MKARHVRFAALAAASLFALVLAACSTTRFDTPVGTTTTTTPPTGGSCQIPLPGGPPNSPTIGGTTQSDTQTTGGLTTTITVTEGNPEPLFGASIVSVSGTWTVTDGSQTCGCSINLTETQLNLSGSASAPSCQSSWLRQVSRFEFRNSGSSVAFFGANNSVLFELQRNGANMMVGFAFGQRITVFRGN